MDAHKLEILQQRYAFATWRDTKPRGENLFVWRFTLNGNEFPGWEAHRIQHVATSASHRLLESIWRRPDGGQEELLRVDVIETASTAESREALLRQLGEYQSPLVARRSETDIGDVAFVPNQDTSIVFAIANLVVVVRNGGRRVGSVTAIARQFDAYLRERPQPGGQANPAIQRFTLLSDIVRVGEPTPLAIEAADLVGRPLWFKIYSGADEVFAIEGRPVYRAIAEGERALTLFALDRGGASSQDLRIVATPTPDDTPR